MSSNYVHVFIHALSDLTVQIMFDSWRASSNVGSKCPIAWNNPRQTPLWRFYLHCRIEETGSPGIICIVWNQVLRHPSEHGTSPMAKHLVAKAHIAKSNKLTQLEVTELTSSKANEKVLAILKRHGSRGITLVSSQRKVKLDIQVWSRCTELTDKTFQAGSEGLGNFRISPRPVPSLPHVRICFGSQLMDSYIISRATTVIWTITKWPSAAIRLHP